MEKNEIIIDCLTQIRESITNLQMWNAGVVDMNDLLKTSNGMQDLAGNCMIIMAIGEGFKKVDRMTDGQLLPQRSDIPRKQVFGLRNRIAHGYFDIDVDIISEVINNDLVPPIGRHQLLFKRALCSLMLYTNYINLIVIKHLSPP